MQEEAVKYASPPSPSTYWLTVNPFPSRSSLWSWSSPRQNPLAWWTSRDWQCKTIITLISVPSDDCYPWTEIRPMGNISLYERQRQRNFTMIQWSWHGWANLRGDQRILRQTQLAPALCSLYFTRWSLCRGRIITSCNVWPSEWMYTLYTYIKRGLEPKCPQNA